jgi:nucleotide-binding universal stress UspA family protein
MTGHHRTILVGVDFSDCSLAALRQAVRMAHQTGYNLRVTHIIEPLVIAESVQSGLGSEEMLRPYAIANGERSVRELDIGCDWPENSEILIRIGKPTPEILALARKDDVELLVLGTHGTSGPTTGVGRLSLRCIRKATARVMLVREEKEGPFRQVVACISFADAFAEVLGPALRVARRDQAQLRLVHVYEGPWRRLQYTAPTPQATLKFMHQYKDMLLGRLRDYLQQVGAELGGLHVEYDLFENSNLGEGIKAYVEQIGADLVVLGNDGHFGLWYTLLGSTTERIVRGLGCSVLTTRPHCHDPELEF